MADTEFEELDKAVASVLGDPAPTTDVPVTVTPPTLVVPERVQETPSAPAAALRTHSPGRFMDVVPPSMIARPNQPAEPVAAAPTPPVEAPATFEQPDPLDFQGFKMDETPAPGPVAAPEPETPPVEPLNTPFLSDAKVEKRPLGAFSDTPKPAEEPIEAAPVAAEPDKEPTTLPAELHTDLLSIESTESETKDIPPVPSIVQQYQEKPNSDTSPSAAIYDTDALHMPLAHPAKKSNSWLIVIWIAALLVVGGGIGVILYFVVLPML